MSTPGPGCATAHAHMGDARRSLDFVTDRLSDGRKFRALTLVDDYTRECPVIEVDFSLPGRASCWTRRRTRARDHGDLL